jgi:hypothetical protein
VISPVPDAILDGLAARPDDVGVWEVLSDFLLEQDAPEATLARCDLELMRGISNPELLEQLSEARAKRPKLPHEPWGGFSALWRCGFLVRLTLDSRLSPMQVAAVLRARAAQGLHQLVFEDVTSLTGGLDFSAPVRLAVGDLPLTVVSVVRILAGAATVHLRRLSLRFTQRFVPLLPTEQRDILEALTQTLPPSTRRVDLALGRLDALAVPALLALAGRLEVLNLDGTALQEPFVESLGAAHATLRLGGTGLSPRALPAPTLQWFSPDVTAWLEREDSGVVFPLTPSTRVEGFDAPSFQTLGRVLRCELLGWTVGRGVLDDGARFALDGVDYTLRLR